MRTVAFAMSMLAATAFPVLIASAEEDHHEHVTEAGGLRIIHPWARAARQGQNTLVFMEIDNEAGEDVLESAETEAANVARIVGVTFKDGIAATQEIGAIDVPPGDFALDPAGLAIELVGLTETLEQGGEFELEVHFRNAGELHLHVDVEAANATQHSHAGHSH